MLENSIAAFPNIAAMLSYASALGIIKIEISYPYIKGDRRTFVFIFLQQIQNEFIKSMPCHYIKHGKLTFSVINNTLTFAGLGFFLII